MYGCYKIKFFDKNKNEIKSIYQKNTITDSGKKKILDMLSFNLTDTYGYKKADIHKGKFSLNGVEKKYKTSFFGWEQVSHPFNVLGSRITLPETEISKNTLTEKNNLSEEKADKILNIQNKTRIDWGSTDSGTYSLDSYKVWFNVAIGVVDEIEEFELPLINETSEILNEENEIKLLGTPIYPNSVTLKSKVIANHEEYEEGKDFKINYKNGILKILNDELREIKEKVNSKNSDNTSGLETPNNIRNIIEITYKWNAARYIDELKNGICGVYINAQPSIKNDSSSYGEKCFFGMGSFSSNLGETWEGYSFPWKGTPLKKINEMNQTDARAGMNLTAFHSLNTEYEHYFPTFPYTFMNPTSFSFAFSSDGKNSFQIKNLNFLVPNFPPPTLQEIVLNNTIIKQIEWSGSGIDDNGYFAEWKTCLDAEEAIGVSFTNISTRYSLAQIKKNNINGWNEIEFPETGSETFSRATFEEAWTKENELIEVSYRIYFSEKETV